MSEEGNKPSSGATSGRQTRRFVEQHEDLFLLAKDLLKALDTRALEVDPTPVRRLLATFSGRLRVHAAMEQQALYPRLLASPNAEVAAKAKVLLDEVGELYDVFFGHLGRWNDAASIKADPQTFCRDTMAILHRLRQRMKRENDELYPLVDRAESIAPGERAAPAPSDDEPGQRTS
jgi:hypothetical protein